MFTILSCSTTLYLRNVFMYDIVCMGKKPTNVKINNISISISQNQTQH